MPYRTQVASDILRDGLGVELMQGDGTVIAEVFRCDTDHTVSVTTFVRGVPLAAMQLLIERAKAELEPFEDGTPLSAAGAI